MPFSLLDDYSNKLVITHYNSITALIAAMIVLHPVFKQGETSLALDVGSLLVWVLLVNLFKVSPTIAILCAVAYVQFTSPACGRASNKRKKGSNKEPFVVSKDNFQIPEGYFNDVKTNKGEDTYVLYDDSLANKAGGGGQLNASLSPSGFEPFSSSTVGEPLGNGDEMTTAAVGQWASF